MIETNYGITYNGYYYASLRFEYFVNCCFVGQDNVELLKYYTVIEIPNGTIFNYSEFKRKYILDRNIVLDRLLFIENQYILVHSN